MQGTRAVQVVLGEGEPGILRLILEAQGFDVVGHARDERELRRVVGLTRPNVIVLDAGISARALLDTQVRSDYVPIVVVWPKDAYTPAAEERVDPSTAVLELGNAVRRVMERHAEPIVLPEADEEPLDPPAAPPDLADRGRGTGRARHALVVVAAWTIALTALAAIGLAVPSALRSLEPAGTLHPGRDRPEPSITDDADDGTGRDGDVDRQPGCARRDEVRMGPHPRRGEAGGLGHGCALGHEKHGAPGTRGKGHGNGHGRPDDPGKGAGRGGANAGGVAKGSPKKGGESMGGESMGGESKGGEPQSRDPDPGGGGGSDDGHDAPSDEPEAPGGGKAGRSDGQEGGSPGQGKGPGKD